MGQNRNGNQAKGPQAMNHISKSSVSYITTSLTCTSVKNKYIQ